VTPVAELLQAHAAALTELELRRRGSALRSIPFDRRRVVAAEAARVAGAVATGLLEQARTSPALAAALASIYADDRVARQSSLGGSLRGAAD
jgi:hypothetical protein